MWGEGDGLAVPLLTPVVLGVVLDERGIVPTLSCRFPPIPTTDQYLGAGASGEDAISETIIIRDITGHNKSKGKPAIQRGDAHLPDCPKYQMLRAKRDGQQIPAQPDLLLAIRATWQKLHQTRAPRRFQHPAHQKLGRVCTYIHADIRVTSWYVHQRGCQGGT